MIFLFEKFSILKRKNISLFFLPGVVFEVTDKKVYVINLQAYDIWEWLKEMTYKTLTQGLSYKPGSRPGGLSTFSNIITNLETTTLTPTNGENNSQNCLSNNSESTLLLSGETDDTDNIAITEDFLEEVEIKLDIVL